jgi:two-component system sensor histidine kinase PhoQ
MKGISALSLKSRVLVAASIAMILFFPLANMTLEKAYTQSLTEATIEQLRLINLSLIAEFELDNNNIHMPAYLDNEKLNLPFSGLYGVILRCEKEVWRSASSLNMPFKLPDTMPHSGEERFTKSTADQGVQFTDHQPYFVYSFTAEFEAEQGFEPFHFVILQSQSAFIAQQQAFSQTLSYWLLGAIAVLLAILVIGLSMALKPVNQLIKQIKLVEQGRLSRIEQQYPPELEKLKLNLNTLLDTEHQQRRRYQNSLSDLAHSLKTPLAVISNHTELTSAIREPVNQINSIIQRQLKRAIAGGQSGLHTNIDIAPVAEKLIQAMQKVHRDSELAFIIDIDPAHQFKGDQTDLMEMLGNLLDNACKAANNKVALSSEILTDHLHIKIEDDGPSIPETQRTALLQRGKRLDTYQEGQGIGLSLVWDLVAAYQGNLNIQTSSLGGASFTLRFPI